MPYSGSCLCGQTKVELTETFDSQIICHCTDCQQTSGSAYSVNVLAKQSEVKITGAVKQYDSKAPSGNTVSRLFCGNCGAAVGHKSVAFGDSMAIQTGLISGFNAVPIGTELFVRSRWSGVPQVPNAVQNQTM